VKFLHHLETLPKLSLVLIGFVSIGAIGVVDFLSGYEYSFALFYVLPIALITWVTNNRVGAFASGFASIVWLVAETLAGKTYAQPFMPVWNSIIRFGLFLVTFGASFRARIRRCSS
jgi:hypothetical protein